jgi:hypothetical protein
VRVVPRTLSEFLLAAFAVLSAISLTVWAVEGLDSSHGLLAKESLDGKLVLTLVFLLLTSLVWGWRRGRGDAGGSHIHPPALPLGHEEVSEDPLGNISRRSVRPIEEES